jgi:hypothetical protein
LFIAIILQCPIYSSGQFSRQQAVDLVLNQILVADTGHISVYGSFQIFQDTSTIILGDGQTILPTFPDNWVFFSDDHPLSNWFHPCRYIFVNSNTGDFQIYESSSYPVDLQISYQALLVNYPCPADCYNDYPPLTVVRHTLPANTNSHLHAVLINGTDSGNVSCTINRDYDIAMIYNALEEIGYTTHYNPPPDPPNSGPNVSNVIVLYDDGAQSPDNQAGKSVFHNDWDGYQCDPDISPCTINEVDGKADWSTINSTFSSLAVGGMKALNKDDQLFIYITGAGGKVGNESNFECYPSINQPAYFTATELNDAVKNINCAQIIFVMQQNYSGGFIAPLTASGSLTDALCKNRMVFTATGNGSTPQSKDQSYKELWMHCGNIGEFTFYFAAALRGYYEGRYPWEWLVDVPVGEFPFNDLGIGWIADGCLNVPQHPPDYNPDSGTPPPTMYNTIQPGNNDGYTQLIEAFNYAKYMDTWCKDGYVNQRQKMYPSNIYPTPYYTNADCDNDYETPQMGISDDFSLGNFMCLNGIAGKTPISPTTIEVFGGSGSSDLQLRGYLLGGDLDIISNSSVHSNMFIGPNVQFTIGVDNANINVDQYSTFHV